MLQPVAEPRPVKEGDYVILDYQGYFAGQALEEAKAENAYLEVGAGKFNQDFERQLIGLNPGSEARFAVDLPNDFFNPLIAGKTVEFQVKLHDIKERVTPDLDDDFAQSLSGKFQTIADLREAVRAWLEPQEQGSVLVFAVKEKFYILPVPKLNRDDENNFSLGADLSLDNLAGLNQQLKLRYETEDADTVSGGEIATYTLSYSYPRLFGGPWLLSSELNQVRAPAVVVTGGVVTSLYESDARSASLHLSRWLNLRGPSRGWQAGGGLVWRRNAHEYLSGAPTTSFIDATAVGIAANVKVVDVRDFLYSRSGEHYGYSGEFGEPADLGAHLGIGALGFAIISKE